MTPKQAVWKLPSGFLFIILMNSRALQASDRLYRSPVFYGRGHAGIADDKDLDNIYYNPSVLKTKTKKENICDNLSSEELASSKENCNFLESKDEETTRYLLAIPAAEISNATYKLLQTKGDEDRLEFIKNNIGTPLHIRNTQLAIFQFRNYAISALQDIQVKALAFNDLENKGIETVDLNLYKTAALSVVRSHSISDWSLGLGIHVINREFSGIKSPVTDVEAIKNLKDITKTRTGNGLAADFGTSYNVYEKKLRIAMSISNVGSTHIRKTFFKGETLQRIKQNIDTGAKYSFRVFGFNNDVYIDVRDIENREKDSVFKKLHLGHEFQISQGLDMSWGINQGYFSFGVKASYRNMLIALGRYSEELGDTAGFRQDERYFIQLRFSS